MWHLGSCDRDCWDAPCSCPDLEVGTFVSTAWLAICGVCHRQQMIFPRPTAIFLIPAMLLGNAAGWVHVGCMHSPCSVQVSVDLAGTGEASESQSRRSHLACSHACRHPGSESAAKPDCDDRGSSDSSSTDEPHRHDSDRCSICQQFFTTRHVAVSLVPPSCIPAEAISQWLPGPETDLFCPGSTGSVSVRGPPSA